MYYAVACCSRTETYLDTEPTVCQVIASPQSALLYELRDTYTRTHTACVHNTNFLIPPPPQLSSLRSCHGDHPSPTRHIVTQHSEAGRSRRQLICGFQKSPTEETFWEELVFNIPKAPPPTRLAAHNLAATVSATFVQQAGVLGKTCQTHSMLPAGDQRAKGIIKELKRQIFFSVYGTPKWS